MKKLITLLSFLIVSTWAFGQSPVKDGRIADTTTVFTENIPIGTKLYSIATNSIWVCKVAAALGTKISTSNFANWTQLATGAAHDAVTIGTANGLSILGQAISMAQAAADGTTFGTSTYTANDFNASSGVISIDYTNGQAASGSTKGFLSSTDWTTFNNKLTSTLTSANIFVGNGSNVATGVAMSGDATMANTGALTIANGAVSLAKMANLEQNRIIGRVSSGTGVPEALTGANVRTISQTNVSQQNFENTTADSTNYTVQLTNTPQALGTITVQLNGQPLIATTQYAIIMTNKIRISVPTYKYDKISVSYSY